jgi:hypothetical protein
VPAGERIQTRPGLTLIPAIAVQPPTNATVNLNLPTDPSQPTLFGVLPPEEGPTDAPFPEWIKGLKEALEGTHYGEAPDNVSSAFQAWVEKDWLGAPFTPAQLREAFSLAETENAYPFGAKSVAQGFARTSPPGTYNPFEEVAFSSSDAKNLLRRAFAIQKDLDNTTSQVAAAPLEGALSAVGLVLAIVYPSGSYVIPYAGKYVGVGNPATSLQATLQDVLDSVGKATRPR